jgi:glucose-6-phosphate 1-epimerase
LRYKAGMETTFVLPQSVRLTTGRGGFPRLEVSTPFSEAHIYLYGAHVSHFAVNGHEPLFFESARAYFELGKPIRGGVPVIFPWFGPHHEGAAKPAHGFARTRPWSLESAMESEDGTVTLVLRLEPDAETAALWPEGGEAWVLRYRVIVGKTLTLELDIENHGETPIQCEEALHTYFAVGDVREIEVQGLEETEYVTVIEDQPLKRQPASPIRFVGETDRVYVNTGADLTIRDPQKHRSIEIGKSGSQSTVVWNPWIEKSLKMADFVPDEWPGMVCVETGNVKENTLQIAPHSRHVTRTVLKEAAL